MFTHWLVEDLLNRNALVFSGGSWNAQHCSLWSSNVIYSHTHATTNYEYWSANDCWILYVNTFRSIITAPSDAC